MSQDLIITPTSTYNIASRNLLLTLHQGNDGGTFGLSRTGQVLWDGCFVLSRYIEQNVSYVHNRAVLELGCGCAGLPGQVSALLGASRVVFSDISEELDCLESTLQCNGLLHQTHISLAPLDWKIASQEKRLYGPLQHNYFDIILCSDIIYEHTYTIALFVLLLLVHKSPAAVILMSNTNRKHVHLFFRKATAFFDFVTVDTTQTSLGGYVNQVLWELRLRRDVDISSVLETINF